MKVITRTAMVVMSACAAYNLCTGDMQMATFQLVLAMWLSMD